MMQCACYVCECVFSFGHLDIGKGTQVVFMSVFHFFLSKAEQFINQGHFELCYYLGVINITICM